MKTMTYTEITETYWENKTNQKKLIAELPPSHRAAWEVLENLNGRGGFDHWFDPIDDEDKDEIFEEISKVIQRQYDASARHPNKC
jgi:hypothetical protein